MAAKQLTVTVTGPTGDLGIALVSALERSKRVGRIIGMARRPFDPESRGWRKTDYRQGDVQDEASVRDAVKGADAVVHLAFTVMGAGDRTRAINVGGSRTVFEAALRAGAKRICYASSVAAYGFHDDNPDWLDEDVPTRGTPAHFYSQQKAEVEALLAQTLLRRRKTSAYVFRPCIVGGPNARMVLEEMPYNRLSATLPSALVGLLSSAPAVKPVLPDPGLRFQLVHEDDVASAFVAGVLGKGPPGPYNLAANGTLTLSDVARALGWYSVPVPSLGVAAAAEVIERLPLAPESVQWIEALRKPVLMRTQRAKENLGWRPKHTARQTLAQMVAAFRAPAAVA